LKSEIIQPKKSTDPLMRLFGGFAVLIVTVGIVDAFLFFQPFAPRPNIQHLRAYPNAWNFQEVQTPGIWAGVSSRGGSLTTENTQISFQTTDPPGTILAFYTSLLTKDGWAERWADSTPPLIRLRNERAFQLLTGDPDVVYNLDISANSRRLAVTDVQIILAYTHQEN